MSLKTRDVRHTPVVAAAKPRLSALEAATQRARATFATLDLSEPRFWNHYEAARLALAQVADALTTVPTATSSGARQATAALEKRSGGFEPLRRTLQFLASPSGRRTSEANFQAIAHAFTERERRPANPTAAAKETAIVAHEPEVQLRPGESWLTLETNLTVIRLPPSEYDRAGEIRCRHPTDAELAIMNAQDRQWRAAEEDYERRLANGQVSHQEKLLRRYGGL